jgi:hypothetical protein
MTFGGVFWISVLAQRYDLIVAPLILVFLLAVHAILGFEIAPLTALLIGAIISVYHQFSVIQEDLFDGFFDYCRFNGVSYLSFSFAKSLSIWVTTLFPMLLVLIVFGVGFVASILIVSQWMLESVCVSCLAIYVQTTNIKVNALSLLLAGLPLLIAPVIFLIDYLDNYNKNNLLIFLGCDIIILCSVCLSFNFSNNRV